VLSVVFALLTALANGSASVCQRYAARDAPSSKALHISLFRYLVTRRVWLAGVVLTIVAAICQATALATGPVALVQPIFIIELPFTLLLASRLAHRSLPRLTWLAVVLVTASLGAGLAAAAPSGGGSYVAPGIWLITLLVAGGFELAVIATGIRLSGEGRAAAFGLAAAGGYALTATLMKTAMAELDRGIGPFFSCWQLYGTAVAGVGALFLLQNSLQAGSLVAAQPALTLGDALISVAFGVSVFGESLRTGGWLAAEIVAVLLVGVGCVELSRSLARTHVAGEGGLAGGVAGAEAGHPPGVS